MRMIIFSILLAICSSVYSKTTTLFDVEILLEFPDNTFTIMSLREINYLRENKGFSFDKKGEYYYTITKNDVFWLDIPVCKISSFRIKKFSPIIGFYKIKFLFSQCIRRPNHGIIHGEKYLRKFGVFLYGYLKKGKQCRLEHQKGIITICSE